MKKEWLLQIVVLLIFYIDSILDIDKYGTSFSNTPGIDFLFLLYHSVLFFVVAYFLIPILFYKRKYILFFVSFISSIILFGIVEEGIVEKMLYPNSRGLNDITWQSIYWFFGEILVPLLAFVSIKLMFDNFAKQQQLEQIEKDNLTNELKFLKSQIQPHILFNSLNNLYNFTLSKSDKAPELVLKLANVLRYILYETTTQKVNLDKELIFVSDYIDLQEMQFQERGKIDFILNKDAGIDNLKVAPFLIIPFVENAFKYSFGTKIKEVIITIKIEIKEDVLKLYVYNNFEDRKAENDDITQNGIGLENVKKRLELLYPNQHDLSIIEKENTYEVQLKLNLK